MSDPEDRLMEIRRATQDVYARTNRLWRGLEGTLPTWANKYSILYGPPVERPPLFFLGANPGGHGEQVTEETWPVSLDYANENASYHLAKFLRGVFTDADRMDMLSRSVGANLLFFRSRMLAKTGVGEGWRDNPLKIRRLLEKFCRREVERLIKIMDPQTIFLMGKGVFEDFVPLPHFDAFEPEGRWLAARGQVNGRPALGIMHPTGSRWTKEEMKYLSDYLQKHLAYPRDENERGSS